MKKISILLIGSFILMLCNSNPRIEAAPNAEAVEFAHYPEDFFIMRFVEDYAYSEPFIYASGEDSNGEYRIACYRDYDAFEWSTMPGWIATQVVYKNGNAVTSEGIAVGSDKDDVANAYKKYGIEEYNLSYITSMDLSSLDIVLKGVNLSDTFLYVDNRNIYHESYTGTDYWGTLEAYIFILDDYDYVTKIVNIFPGGGDAFHFLGNQYKNILN